MPPETRARWLNSLSDAEKVALQYSWPFWARPDQLPPAGDWATWLCLAGRGWGKTRVGAEWVRQIKERVGRIGLIAPTAADARDVMVEGESGLLAISPPWDRPLYEPSKRRVTWDNGAMAFLYSADEPDRLRGPQHGALWADELAAWRYPQNTWDMAMFGLRLGDRPQSCVTTTPRPIAIIRDLLKDAETATVRGRTYDNLSNLAPTFRKKILAKYEGTRLGRQELDAEILDDVPGALWTWAMIEASRVEVAPELSRTVVAIDPPATADGDECGIVAAGIAGLSKDGTGYILEDASEGGLSPNGWASKAIAIFDRLSADRVIIETNQGGDMAEQTLRQVRPNLPITRVHASKGKMVRAEPVSALYEKARVRHVGPFPELEEQMTSYTGDRRQASPDRLDAMVYALTDLFKLGTSLPFRAQRAMSGLV